MRFALRIGLCLMAALAVATMAQAQNARPGSALPQTFPQDDTLATRQANAGTVGVVSGGVDGTYIRIAADLASVLDDGDKLRVLPMIGKGSVQNTADILRLRGIDIGIVQGDALTYIEQKNLYPGVQQRIAYVTKLYEEEVHVLARKEITDLADLANKKVNVDVEGSGTAMTASVLFGILNIPITATHADQASALEQLQQGDVAAVVYVVGKPARLFGTVPADSGLHFLSIPTPQQLLDVYVPTQLRHADYPALIPENDATDTVAVGSVMAVYNWPLGSERYAKVAKFVDAFFSKFPEFQKPPRHPKWREVNLAADVPGWQRFPAAQQWLQRAAIAGNAGGAVQTEFNTFLVGLGGPLGSLSETQKAALFQQFLQWERTRGASQ
ncbi:MAG: TRAP transporter substrate-binding protein [Acidisphaera sp.]|nr:TRAP transporter substrate-binding protein [Acidisphaera sp.]MBV9812677.1 TRAP transporter substrate-binding protein [Acetobacteraceae bacterium]